MQFTCQRTGKCCTHSQIVITLTHKDLWVLFQHAQDMEELKQFIQFILIEKKEQSEKLVLNSIETTEGKGIFILRKNVENKCIFYKSSASSCQIHDIRPQACRNFPFAFAEIEDKITVSLVKGASSFCIGIGKGKEYEKNSFDKVGMHTIEIIKRYNAIAEEINKEAQQKKPLTPQMALGMLLLVAEKEQINLEEEFQIL